MQDRVKVAVIFYSATGTVYRLAQAVAGGACDAGAEVRLRKVRELAPPEAIASNPRWAQTAEEMKDVPEAELADLVWADAVLLGTPTRFGGIAAQLKEFIDTTGPIWQQGKLANKVYGAFTAAGTAHGGHESTILSVTNIFHHWGGIIVPPGYTAPIQFQVGNPYGVSSRGEVSSEELEAARYQGRRAVEIARLLKAGRGEVPRAA